MRRSAAPSALRRVSDSPNLALGITNQPLKNVVPARSTASILGLLSRKAEGDGAASNVSDNGEEWRPVASVDTFKENDNTGLSRQPVVTNTTANKVEHSQGSGKMVYTVVWGKQTTKKHKTYEFDGTLEVGEKTLVLKDDGGNVIGRCSVKKEPIEEGSCLNVGSKAVEVIEPLTGAPQIKVVEREMERPAPRPFKRMRPATQPVPTSESSPHSRGFQLHYDPLNMTKPPHDHQWRCNEARLPVVEVSVDPCLVRVLRPHQREGVLFLYECVMGMRRADHHGAILADEMGLGKTLQCITLAWMLLKHGPYGDNPVVRRVLVVTPSSLVVNWEREFIQWLGRERVQPFVVDQKNKPKDYVKLGRLPVMLISYEMFVRYFEDIQPIRFDLVFCDEGHRLKNTSIRTSTLLKQVECKRRVLLTGTPIQNDLQEFFALVDFVNPGLLGTRATFHKHFEEPIVASRQPGVDEDVGKLGEERATELNNLTNGFIMRRTQEVINKYLPKKQESVVFCCTSPLQQEVYKAAVKYWADRVNVAGGEGVAHLGVIMALKKICNHPVLVTSQQTNAGGVRRPPPLATSQADNLPEEENLKQHLSNMLRPSRVLPTSSPEHSGKLSVVLKLLEQLSGTKEKIVLVSYFTQTLDMFAALCDQRQYKYCRLDGSTPSGQRMEIVTRFNATYSQQFVFLLSARAGGVGLNLTGASRLVLYDSDWNPATDLQAMARIWRDGQKTSVHIYRLLTAGTIEEKIFQRQISKTGLSGTVVDPHCSDAIRLSNEELKDLFTFHADVSCLTHDLLDCRCPGDGSIPGVPETAGEPDPEEDLQESLSSRRDCQLRVADDRPLDKQSLRMNQLYDWEHHSQPFGATVLQEMGLSTAASFIKFIFRNNSSV